MSPRGETKAVSRALICRSSVARFCLLSWISICSCSYDRICDSQERHRSAASRTWLRPPQLTASPLCARGMQFCVPGEGRDKVFCAPGRARGYPSAVRGAWSGSSAQDRPAERKGIRTSGLSGDALEVGVTSSPQGGGSPEGAHQALAMRLTDHHTQRHVVSVRGDG